MIASFIYIAPSGGDNMTAVITSPDGVQKVNLLAVTRTHTLELGGEYGVTLLVERGAIQFRDSACRDRICVKSGVLNRIGDIAVCLPAHVSVRIEGKDDANGVDAVTG
ncbi:MAG: NusG domain II-containing protein [Oscillospiraceae bacterium]|jgi:hypothetical protein|nr:NusG domain II-containing protein [Oscillospiraceae bacterium]